MGKLTAKQVEHAKPGKHGDGQGLYLEVSPTGGKKWTLRIQRGGRRRDIGLGSARDVSLADARERADDMRRAFRRGEDPVKARRGKGRIPTFREVAEKVHEEHRKAWKNAKHRDQWKSTLRTYVYPVFGETLVSEIGSSDVHDAIAPIWLVKPETARRTLQRIIKVLDFAHAKGWREAEAPLRAVRAGLPKLPERNRHFEAMPWADVPAFFAEMPVKLKGSESVRLLLEFIVLTASRSGEARGMTWGEVDLDTKVWEVPAERMKMKRPHRVPLCDRAVEILRHMQEARRTDSLECLVFEGKKLGRPLSDMTLTQALRRAGYGVTVHGFRSSFRDYCAEATSFASELAEKALAHVNRDKTEAAYQRGDLFERRRELMAAWEAHCLSQQAADAKVTRLHKAR